MAGIAAAGAGFSGAIGACTGDAADFDASTVDELVAIAAAAIASGSAALPLDAGATITSETATGTAIATATETGVAAVGATGCSDAVGSEGNAVSGAATISKAASLVAVFTMPDFADPNLGLAAAVVSALPSGVAGCAALDFVSPEAVVAAALGDVVSRGCRLSDAADVSSERDGRSGGRSLLGVSAALLSISAEKLPDAGDWSARADLDGAF